MYFLCAMCYIFSSLEHTAHYKKRKNTVVQAITNQVNIHLQLSYIALQKYKIISQRHRTFRKAFIVSLFID